MSAFACPCTAEHGPDSACAGIARPGFLACAWCASNCTPGPRRASLAAALSRAREARAGTLIRDDGEIDYAIGLATSVLMSRGVASVDRAAEVATWRQETIEGLRASIESCAAVANMAPTSEGEIQDRRWREFATCAAAACAAALDVIRKEAS